MKCDCGGRLRVQNTSPSQDPDGDPFVIRDRVCDNTDCGRRINTIEVPAVFETTEKVRVGGTHV